jgi:hypothetical protein
MDKQVLVDGFNRILNNSGSRKFEREGVGRYFDREFFNISDFDDDPELYDELVAFIKSLNKTTKQS